MKTENFDIEKFYNCFEQIIQSTSEKRNVVKIGNFQITQKDKDVILKSIELRKLINDLRDVNEIEKYKRRNAEQVDLKAMIGEHCFSRLLYTILKNKYTEDFLTTVPAIAEMILNRKKQDFEIENLKNNKIITFDIKSQFENNDFNFLTVNIKSFQSMKNKSSFFILCLIDGKQDDFNTNNNVCFYLIKNDWFENNSEKVLTSSNPRFTPYLKLSLKYFK